MYTYTIHKQIVQALFLPSYLEFGYIFVHFAGLRHEFISETARKYPQHPSNCFEKSKQLYRSDEHLINHITSPRQ